MQKYNECFFEMRIDLKIEPINFYTSYSQMRDKASNTYLCLKNGVIAGFRSKVAIMGDKSRVTMKSLCM